MAACRSLATALPVLTIGVWLQRTFRDLESRLLDDIRSPLGLSYKELGALFHVCAKPFSNGA